MVKYEGKRPRKLLFPFQDGRDLLGSAATLLLTTVLLLSSPHSSNSAPNSPLLGNSPNRKHQLLIAALS